MKKLTQLMAIVLAIGMASSAQAAWEGDEKPEFSNAYTLRSGEWQIGLFRPTTVGLTDRLELSTVLIGDALGVANARLEFNLIDSKHFALSVTGAGLYSFVNDRGLVAGGLTATVPIADRLLISASAGYSVSEGYDDGRVDFVTPQYTGGFDMTGEVSLLLNPHNILVLTANATYNPECNCMNPPTGGFFYAHAWDSFRLMAGVLFHGQEGFEFDTGEEEISSPILPMIDFWWRW